MNRSSSIGKFALLLGCLFILSSCATIARERGYSFTVPENASNSQKVSCGETKYYFSNIPNYKAVISQSDISTQVVLADGQEVNWISFGPGIIIPLPLIPWPFGIANILAGSGQSDIDIIAMNVSVLPRKEGFTFNPFLVMLKTGNDSIFPFKVTQDTKDSIILWPHIQIINPEHIPIRSDKFHNFNLFFHIPTPNPLEMDLILNGLMFNQEEVHYSTFKVYYFKGTRLYWAMTINC